MAVNNVSLFETMPEEIGRPDWTTPGTVAHSMGMTREGCRETNSLEALETSYERGFRVFETDFQLTSDGYLVARHDWEQTSCYNLEQTFVGVMDHETFMSTPICFYYKPMDINGILAWMKVHSDAYIVTDSRNMDEQTVRAQMRVLREAVERSGDAPLWERLIIQIYHEDMCVWTIEETRVTNWIFTLYQTAQPDYEETGAFCSRNGIDAVTIDKSRMSPDCSSTLHFHGYLIYLHTVNRLVEMKNAAMSADGFYTDIISPSQLSRVLDGTAG